MPPDLRLAPGYGLAGILHPDAAAAASSSPPVDPVRPGVRGVAGADDAYWMRQALLCAMAAEGRASPNPTVGAVIVKDGVLIATGATEPYGGRHAERCAIDSVPDRSILRGATIYTTLEPCAHWGKQPPCADLVASCGFARCVSGIRDPDPRVAGLGLERVRGAGTEVSFGPLRNEIVAWHLPYLTQRLAGRPLISARTAPFPYRDRLRRQSDVLITGVPTVAPLSPAPGRGVIWWDLDGRTAQLTEAGARDLSAQAQALDVPVILVAHQATSLANVTPVVPRAGSPAAWLRAYSASAELAGVIGEQPNWLLIDDHPALAEALAAGDGLDVVHASHPSTPPFGDLVEITRDELIAEYLAKDLLSVLAGML
ncbi:bifunctional diaminohydroxyphosphoribosylaminopyrimidine deaminase/5-amino-6-(5-phosphoribosylamino)uracil reductase RibD [Actinoplanes sp. NPDC000266]